MNFALLSLHDPPYQPLANLTWPNKIKYAERHGYSYACKTDNWYGIKFAFEKVWFIRDMMDAYPEIDWFWWVGCDTLVTNMTIPLDQVVDNNYHFMIATDCNGINADSILMRNSEKGRDYIDVIKSKYEQYKDHHWYEQQIIIDTHQDYPDVVKLVPQRMINAYNYDLYPGCDPHDKFGNDGMWKPGDLLIHWPGTNLPHRIHLANAYLNQVIE